MRKVLIIARREYRAMVGSKAFMITLALMPILMVGGIFVQQMLQRRVNLDEKRMVILDGTGLLFDHLSQTAQHRNEHEIFDPQTHQQIKPRYQVLPGPEGPVTDAERMHLSARIRRGEIYAFAEIPGDIFDLLSASDGPKATFFAQNTALSDEKSWFQQVLNNAVRRERLRKANIDPDLVDRASAWVPVEGRGLFEQSNEGGPKAAAAKSEELAIMLPFGIMMLMLMVIMLTSQPMIESVLEEKGQRIAEVLLGSVSPSQLMAGKMLGCVAGSLTVVAVYGLGAWGMAQYYHVAHLAPLKILPWFLVYQVLAVVLFSSIFMAVGACVNDRKEAQGLLIPVMLLMMFPMFIWLNVVREPTGSMATWTSFVPPATPMLMVLRMTASSEIPLWQPVLGVLLLLAATGLCVFAAGRIFRIGILAQGSMPKLKQLLRWIVTG